MKLQFQYPEYLVLLVLVPFFILLLLANKRWKKRMVKRLGEPRLVKELYSSYSPIKSLTKFILIVIAFALGVVALANLRKPSSDTQEARKGIDILVALDVSNSMLATDVQPSRMQQARQLVLQLINQFPNDRIGLVLFAGNAYLQMPLTFDHQAAQLFVSTANPGAITAQGTAIGDALQKAALAFDPQSTRFKTILLITDGETHDQNAAETAKDLATRGIMINTVGIGSEQGATIMDTLNKTPKKDLSGNVVISKLNAALLKQIAAETNGEYIHMDNVASAVSQLQQQLSQVDRKPLADISQFNYTTFYAWLAVPMLLLLVSELFLSNRKKAVV